MVVMVFNSCGNELRLEPKKKKVMGRKFQEVILPMKKSLLLQGAQWTRIEGWLQIQ